MNKLLYTRKAFPAVYKGIQFRSRNEARWAAYFDLLSDVYVKTGQKPLVWHYEPLDLDGWIPDFGLESANRPDILILCEVKPIHFIKAFQELDDWKDIVRAVESLPPMERSSYLPVVCGLTPFFSWHFINGWDKPVQPAIPDDDRLWRRACNITQWRAPK